jgi:hypothetical protein
MLKKNILAIIVVIIICGIGFWFWQFTENNSTLVVENENIFNPLNATYIIDSNQIALVNGASEQLASPGSATKIITKNWNDPTMGDLNSDGLNDAAFIVTYDSGGSGTFYYAVAALQDGQTNKAIGTNGILIGDRIAPQNLSISKGIITINYVDRKPGEPFSVPPSVGVTKYLKLTGTNLIELNQKELGEMKCVNSGGTVATSSCCLSAGDFSNSCLIGACGCSPSNSKAVETCNCGIGKCFDINSCVTN